MRFLVLFILICVWSNASLQKQKCGVPATQEDCENLTTEYEKYRECMEHRIKRSLDCTGDDDYEDDTCSDCNCNACSYNTCENCSNNYCCSQCCPRSSCASYSCCHQMCRAECKSNTCRTSCKKKCQERTSRITGSGGRHIVFGNTTVSNKNALNHNITTVIHLNNVINNTNLINLPINVNNTVFNNITSSRRNGNSIKETLQDNCCITIGPRQCVPQKDFPFVRCFHIRKRVCGYICTAPVVHYQKHEVCDNDVNVQQPCHQQVIYVPQPQPRCAYQQTWPYVTCGNNEYTSCEGCYDHYIKREDVTKCSNFCYDDGYGIGPYYRQGPFYRPGYAHAASCIQTGMCGGFDEGFGEYPEYGGIGFPFAYPAATYPFIIEDCPNCTHTVGWDSSNPNDPILTPKLHNNPNVQWSNISDKMMNIDAQIDQSRPERYAQIKIQSAKEGSEQKKSVYNVTATTKKLHKM